MKLTELPTIQPQLPTFIQTEKFVERWNIKYAFEPKFDGFCCILYWTREDGVNLQSRTEKKVTHVYKSFTDQLNAYLCETKFEALILHGELIAIDGDHPGGNLPALQNRNNTRCQLQYRVFDFLQADHQSLCGMSYAKRRAYLERYFNSKSAFIKLVPTKASKEDLPSWPNMEGFVAKNIASLYIGNRQKSWFKIKPREGKDFICTGFNPGVGRRYNTIGSLQLTEIVGEEAKYVGDVGTGFTDATLDVLNNWIQKNCAESWTPFIVEVQYARRTTDGKLWHPSYIKAKFPGE